MNPIQLTQTENNYPWTSERMAAEMDVVAPMIATAIQPGGRTLHCGYLWDQYEETLLNLSASVNQVHDDMSLGIISTGFDTIVAPFLLQTLIDEEVYAATVNRIHECLKPGGALIVVDHEVMEEKIEGILPRGMFGVLEQGPWLGARNEVCSYTDHWFAIFLKKPCELPEVPCPVFREAEDGKIFLEEDPGMPDMIAIASELLANPRLDRPIERDGDRVTITAENGHWVFGIVGWGRHGEAVCQLEGTE